jgi:hypothetical protein
MTVYTILFAVEALIVLIGVLVGLKRGMAKSLVRLVELIIVAIVSLLISKGVMGIVSEKATELIHGMLEEPLKSVILSSPDAEALVLGLVGALVLPIVFVIVFAVLKLLSLICLGLITKLIAGNAKKNRLIGAAVGAVTGVLVASVFLCPFYTLAKTVAALPAESLSVLDEIPEAETVKEFIPDKDMTPPVSAIFVNLASSFEVNEKTYNASEETPKLIALVSDVMGALKESEEKGEEPLLGVASAISATVKHLEDSEYIATLTTSLLNSIGESIKNGNDIFGIANGMQGPVADVMLASLGNILTGVTPENIADNIPALTGDGEKYGVISIITEINSTGNIKEAIKDKEKMDKLVDSIITIAENPNLSNTMDAIADIGTSMITENAPEKGSDYHTEYINALSESVNELLVATKDTQNDFASNVETAKDIVIEKVSKTDKDITESEAKLIAICALHSFGTDENYANAENAPISVKDIENFMK